MTADWLGPRTFPNLWMKACKLWVIVALGALIMVCSLANSYHPYISTDTISDDSLWLSGSWSLSKTQRLSATPWVRPPCIKAGRYVLVLTSCIGTDHYLGNDQSVYDRMDGDPNAGYVGNTNIPKHLGGVVYVVSSSPITLHFSAFFFTKELPLSTKVSF